MNNLHVAIFNYNTCAKVRSLQIFKHGKFLSLRGQQRNGLNGTVESLNCFLT